MSAPSKKPDLQAAARAIADFLQALGLSRDTIAELAGTPQRVAEMYATTLLRGYSMEAGEILRDRTASKAGSLVVVSGIRATTMCPHHLLPAQGEVHVGYLPGEHVVGFGALERLVACFTCRLALQEDIAEQIATALETELGAAGAACWIQMNPSCLTAKPGNANCATASCISLTGTMKDDSSLQEMFRQAISQQISSRE